MDSTKSDVSSPPCDARPADVSATAETEDLLALTPRGLEILQVLADVFDATGCKIPGDDRSDRVPANLERLNFPVESPTETET